MSWQTGIALGVILLTGAFIAWLLYRARKAEGAEAKMEAAERSKDLDVQVENIQEKSRTTASKMSDEDLLKNVKKFSERKKPR